MEKVQRLQGVVKFFHSERGFGFVKRDDGIGDVFIHANELKRSGITEDLESGDRIEFELQPVPNKGPKAVAVKLIAAAGFKS